MAVQLDVPGTYVQAIVRPGARVSATVEIPLGQELSPVSRQAMGTLLLQAGGCVRCVRGAIRGESAALELRLGSPPTAGGLNQQLAALSVAAAHVDL